jgi:amino acid adenylation domain-containing protein
MKNVEDIYRLSPTQEGMLFQSLYDPAADVFFRQMVCDLRGALDPEAFEGAWRQALARHAVLRTAFVWEGLEKPVQVVRARVELPWQSHDWRGLAAEEQQARLESLLEADRAKGFNLSSAPLMRLALARLGEEEYRLVWSHHHLLLDGWSKSLLFGEVLTLYGAARGEQAPAPPRPRPFRDYIAWLKAQDSARAEAFWRGALRGFRAPTPLGMDAGARPGDPKRDDAQQLRLSAEATAAIQGAARRHRLTLNTLLQGAWALLLSSYSGEPDVVFGNAVAGRPSTLEGAESMVGLFINTLPVRARVTPDDSLASWLRRLQEQQAEARRYEFSSLVEIQGWSEVERGWTLFESIVVFENYPLDLSLAGGGVEVRDFRFVESTDFPLTVEGRLDGPLSLKIIHDCRRFDAEAARRMLGHIATLLEGFAADPERRISELNILTDEERRRLLVEWNSTAADYPSDRCLHELFEAQAARTPDAAAVEFDGEELTYAELDARSDQLARHLRALGVGPETRVGICVERSLEMVVGLLGILKAGGAYVPLDPEYPHERIALMLEDSEVAVLLTQSSLLEALPAHGAHVLCLDAEADGGFREGEEGPAARPLNTAYVIYTSGSTGRPKGVEIPHRAVVNFLHSMRREPGLAGGDVLLAVTTLSFDIAALEIFLPLSVGAKLCVVSREVASDGARLASAIESAGATVVQATPATWRMLLESGWEGGPRLRILCGGEALDRDLAERLRARCSVLWNMYGPTETTVWSALRRVGEGRGTVSIGRPIANTEIYLLDAQLRPVPAGVAGELYIGGDGLARGYLKLPAMTAERFVPHPFGRRGGERLYRTGDLARYLADGNVEFLGRADHQVKVRGHRIEAGEIEAALKQRETVSEAVVVARDEADGEKRLVAYVVGRGETETPAALRQFLRTKLPEYMIPSAFVALAALPLTPNGKVDRKALPAPEQSGESEGGYVAPRTQTEEVLAGVWASVLKVERVGVRDHFFDLGGHSLLATRILARVGELFRVKFPLRRFFETPTIEELARAIGQEQRAGGSLEGPPPLTRAPRDGELPLSYTQQRMWFIDQLEPGSTQYNMPAAVRLKGALDVAALERAIDEIVRRHEVLRTTFVAVEGRPRQLVAPPQEFKLRVEDLGALPEAGREVEVRRRADEEARTPFDITRGPLLRTSLLRLAEDEHVLLFVVHHIIFDGWSTGVLLRELSELYAAFTRGLPSPLGELPVQYADFAVWQRGWLRGETLQALLDGWRARLDGAPASLDLPTDRPRPPAQSFRGAAESLELGRELTGALKALGAREGVTLFMTLLAAYKVLLYRYTRQEDIVVGTPIANRNHAGLEELIGPLVNSLVLRTDLSGNPTFGELLARVRDVTLDAYALQDMPFEQLVLGLLPERDEGRHPIFQILFGLNNNEDAAPAAQLPGVSMTPLAVHNGAAKFDIELLMIERGEGLFVSAVYNSDLFDAATIALMLGRYESLLGEVVAKPDWRLLDIPLLAGETEARAAAPEFENSDEFVFDI